MSAAPLATSRLSITMLGAVKVFSRPVITTAGATSDIGQNTRRWLLMIKLVWAAYTFGCLNVYKPDNTTEATEPLQLEWDAFNKEK